MTLRRADFGCGAYGFKAWGAGGYTVGHSTASMVWDAKVLLVPAFTQHQLRITCHAEATRRKGEAAAKGLFGRLTGC